MSGAMAKDRPFSYEDIKFAKNFLSKIWNAARLVQSATKEYKTRDTTRRSEAPVRLLSEASDKWELEALGIVDRWIVSRMNQVIGEYSDAMEKFEFHTAIRTMQNFFWHDFCDNYLEYVKHRIYGEDAKAKTDAQFCLLYVLRKSVKLLALVTPHISEEIYSDVFKSKDSIHLSIWPTEGERDASAVASLEQFNRIISELRQHKARNRMAQNAELSKVRLSLPEPLIPELENELKQISRIKEIEQIKGEFGVSVL